MLLHCVALCRVAMCCRACDMRKPSSQKRGNFCCRILQDITVRCWRVWHDVTTRPQQFARHSANSDLRELSGCEERGGSFRQYKNVTHLQVDLPPLFTSRPLSSHFELSTLLPTHFRLPRLFSRGEEGKLQEILPGIHRVSNPSTVNQRISNPAHSLWCKSKITLGSELGIQINLQGVWGVESRRPRSFWCRDEAN